MVNTESIKPEFLGIVKQLGLESRVHDGLQGPSNVKVGEKGKAIEGVGPISTRFSFGDFVGVWSKVAGTPVPRFLGIVQDEIRIKLRQDFSVSVSYLVQKLGDFLDNKNEFLWVDEDSKDWVITGSSDGMPEGVRALIEARLFVGECDARIEREVKLREARLGVLNQLRAKANI